MADDKKAGGMRDIKDLKARLGLAKGAGAAAPAPGPQGSGTGPQPAQRGVVPPPVRGGGGQPGYVPPPPGFPQPQAYAPEPEPPIDARHDPFGAMAQRAQQVAVAQPQQIIPGFDDGKPVEAVNKPSKARVLFYLLIAFGGLGVGIALGHVAASNRAWNHTVSDGKTIWKSFNLIDAQVKKLGDALATKRSPEGRLAAGPDDKAFLDQLETFKFDDKEMANWKTILLNSNYRYMEKPTVDSLMLYYLSLNQLYMMVQQHVVMTRNDLKVIEKTFEKGGAKYAAFFRKQQPGTAGWPFLEIVELVRPVCDPDPANGEVVCQGTGEQQACGPSQKCMAKPELSWEYRGDAGKITGKLKFASSVEAINSEVLIPMSDTRLLSELSVGVPGTIAKEQYLRRLVDIDRAYSAVNDLRTRITEVFQKVELKKSKRFSL